MKLLIVDPNISLSSPSMKGVVRSLPALRRAGFTIELWCWDCDPGLEAARIVRLPRIGAMRGLGTHVFGLWARLRHWWRFAVRREPRPDVIYTVAWYLPDCDVCHVHFSPWDWELRQRQLGVRSLSGCAELALTLLGRRRADAFLRRTTARRILCVSNAVAGDLRRARPGLAPRIGVLPNSFDPARFHRGVRDRWRAETRAQFGWEDRDAVFLFVSTGHYRRKGFPLAVAALETLRRTHPSARLLVVGGSSRRLRALQAGLDADHPQWREFVTFAGNVPDVEKYFAAADALLFPSYSEAFALVEVEADACGLPLFLTPHHGSEMILEDGTNGRLVEFDAGRIAAVLGEFVTGRWQPSAEPRLRAPDAETYARLLTGELLAAAGRSCPAPEPATTRPAPAPA